MAVHAGPRASRTPPFPRPPAARPAPAPVAVLALALALAGCAAPAPEARNAAEALALLSGEAWWERLSDPALDRLAALALSGSPSLALARERVAEAEAARDAVPGRALLEPSLEGGAAGGGGAGPVLEGTARLGLSFLLDPWGGRRQTLRAAEARLDAAEAEVEAARLLLLLNVANAYLDLRYRQRLVALAESDLSGRQDTLALTQRLGRSEAATRIELARAEARVAEARAELPGLRAAVAGGLAQVAVLAGAAPGALPPDLQALLAAPAAQPVPGLRPDVGIPADMLRSRPDLRVAEASYRAALAEVGEAEAALYPSLSLTGLLSLDLAGGGLDYFLGPSLALPALPGDGRRAAVSAASARARQAHETWRQTALVALAEVETALAQYEAATAAAAAAAQAARLHREARDLTRRVYEEGEATFGDLVAAEEAVAQADRRLAGLRLQQAQAFAALNVRLGIGA
mgnify:FL=1